MTTESETQTPVDPAAPEPEESGERETSEPKADSSLNTSVWRVCAVTPVAFLFVVVVLRTAWLCDDAYITFRTVENVVDGYGPRWNTDERVQAFTHPLWMLTLTASRALTGELFYTTYVISILFAVAAVLILVLGASKDTTTAFALAAVLVCSKAFVEYSTSGLENPLSYFLAAAFVWALWKREASVSTLFLLSLLGGLMTLNRMDTVLLCLPALALAFWQVRSLRAFGALALGFLPFVAWEIFSIVYYGFPFPNTAYAKLDVGIDREAIWFQGLMYFVNSIRFDPITLVATGLGLAAVAVVRTLRAAALAAGVAAYLAYVVYIGGDFMSGRFFALPLLVSLGILARVRISTYALPAVVAAAMTAGLLSPLSPLRSDAGFGNPRKHAQDGYGIADERQFYFQSTGLLSAQRNGMPPKHKYIAEGKALRRQGKVVAVHGSAGFRGYYGGPEPHIVDYYALADPLLARLPARYQEDWRIGHYRRVIPKGYVETLRMNEDRFADPSLSSYYDALKLITQGPLFGSDRWRAMVTMNVGGYDHLIDDHRYRHPEIREIPYRAVSDAGRGRPVGMEGVDIRLDEPATSGRLTVTVADRAPFTVSLLLRGRVRWSTRATPEGGGDGPVQVRIDIPISELSGGYDTIRIAPDGKGKISLVAMSL